LPAAAPANIAMLADPTQEYAFIDRADDLNDSFADAPPDYGFDYVDDEQPWVWRADDGSVRICEPLPDGAYRCDYYEPGAFEPYLISDPDGEYGFDNGVLIAAYDPGGRLLPADALRARADLAGRELAWGEQVWRAQASSRRVPVAAAAWQDRRRAVAAAAQRLVQDRGSDPAWRAYHAAHVTQESAYWAPERVRREAEAARFAQQTRNPAAARHDWAQAGRAQQTAAGAPAPGLFSVRPGRHDAAPPFVRGPGERQAALTPQPAPHVGGAAPHGGRPAFATAAAARPPRAMAHAGPPPQAFAADRAARAASVRAPMRFQPGAPEGRSGAGAAMFHAPPPRFHAPPPSFRPPQQNFHAPQQSFHAPQQQNFHAPQQSFHAPQQSFHAAVAPSFARPAPSAAPAPKAAPGHTPPEQRHH
jgi:hypothetical protein